MDCCVLCHDVGGDFVRVLAATAPAPLPAQAALAPGARFLERAAFELDKATCTSNIISISLHYNGTM